MPNAHLGLEEKERPPNSGLPSHVRVQANAVDGLADSLNHLDDIVELADLGQDTASPVSDDYDGRNSVFTGTVNWVQIDLGEDAKDADHLITTEERLRVAMARQ